MKCIKLYIVFLLIVGYSTETLFAQKQVYPYGYEIVLDNFKLLRENRLYKANSLGSNIYADTDRVVSVISSQPYNLDFNSYDYESSFLSIHDASGLQISLKELIVSGIDGKTGPSKSYELSYCNNIERLDNGNYMISGRVGFNMRTDSAYSPACEYIFDKNGDSVSLHIFYSTDTSVFIPVDMVKSPTGELMSMYRDINYNRDSFIWILNSSFKCNTM